jgi:queuine tRNA-ribosyltransferase
VAGLGGLHRFMGWDEPLMTDSGGFQVFSLPDLRIIGDDGVSFHSHIDGSLHFLTSQKIIAIEEQLGADIILPLDVCTPFSSDHAHNAEALERTHRWAELSRQVHSRSDQALFGIVQGGTFADLRRASARFIAGLDFPGYSIGGLSVGEPKATMHAMIEEVVPLLPDDHPRHLLGVGSPEDLFECVARGIDIFDCVLPTRLARNAAALTRTGRINLRNAPFAADPAPIEEGCACYTCQNFSRGYLRHLFKAEEILALQLTTLHNLHFILSLMCTIRRSILDGDFAALKDEFLASHPVLEEARSPGEER